MTRSARRQMARSRGQAAASPERPAEVRGAKRHRRDEKRRRQSLERDLERMGRQRRILGALGFVPLLLGLSCSLGLGAFWCAIDPFYYMLGFSAILGLYIGTSIRAARERRRLERGEIK